MGPQGYTWPAANMMAPGMQGESSFRPSVAMDPSMMPPYYGTGVPQAQQWQNPTMPMGQGQSTTQMQPDQSSSQQQISSGQPQ